MQRNFRKLQFAAITLVLIFVQSARSAEDMQSTASANELVGITAPYQSAILACTQPARISRIAFPEGSYVSQGSIVVFLEDAVQRARTILAEITMESTLPIELERAKLVKARRDVERLQRLHGSDYASSKELSDALSALEIAEVSHNLAVFQQQQALLNHQKESEVLREFQLAAPFDGYVSAHLKYAGETVDQLEGVVRLVQLDPLLVTVDCPLDLAHRVVEGGQYTVRPSACGGLPRMGTVIFASQVADAASQTFRVKLKVDNTDRGWLAGWKVTVDFDVEKTPVGDVASRVPCEAGAGDVQH